MTGVRKSCIRMFYTLLLQNTVFTMLELHFLLFKGAVQNFGVVLDAGH